MVAPVIDEFETRKQHSIAYKTNTSEIKDDIPALAACMVRKQMLHHCMSQDSIGHGLC